MRAGVTDAEYLVLNSVRRCLERSAGDSVLHENVRRHCQNLERLAAGLRALGMDDREIGENVLQVFRSYERELFIYLDEVQGREHERV